MSNSSSKKPGRIIFLFLLVLGLIAAGNFIYNNFVFTKGFDRELLASLPLAPNDTSETVLSYNDEVQLKIPKGLILLPDTLDIYSVSGVEKPQFSDSLVKVYDIGFKHVNKFDKEINIELSYKSEVEKGELDKRKEKHLLYYNEAINLWEDVNAEIDRDNYKIYFSTNHLSSYGITEGNVFDNPFPLMELHTMKQPFLLNSKPDINKAEQILSANSEYSSNSLADSCGIGMIEEAFNLSAAFTSLGQEIMGLPFVETFNNVASELGLLFSLKQFAFEIYEGKEEQGKMNLAKNLTLYSLGKWGSQSLRIANIGIFFIDYSLSKFGAKGLEVREQNYRDIYDNFNLHHNPYRKDAKGWASIIIDSVSAGADLKTLVDNEMNNYLNACFNEEGSLIPDDVREILVKKEKEKLLITIHEALKTASTEMEEKRKSDITAKLVEAKNLLNRKLQLRVAVFGKDYEDETERKKTVGLPVRVFVKKNPNLWAGTTDYSGQWWMECTWLGYLYYGKPAVVELDYKGNILKQNIIIDNFGFKDVRFYLPDEEEEDQPEKDTVVTEVAAANSESITIGTQVWMAKNLNVDKFRNGDPIPQVCSQAEWEQAGKNGTPAWCNFNNPEQDERFGKMYNWYAVSDPRGLAPEGWHVPTLDEWNVLFNYLGGADVAGGKLKATTEWELPNEGATDEVGFSAYPVGTGGAGKYSIEFGNTAMFWTSTPVAIQKGAVHNIQLRTWDINVTKFFAAYVNAMSVRCIKDK